MNSEFKKPSNWIKHGIEGIVLSQILQYLGYLAFVNDSKTLFGLVALKDLYVEGQGNIGGMLVTGVLVAGLAYLIEKLQEKVSKGTKASVADIIITGIAGAAWFLMPLNDSLGATITAVGIGIIAALYMMFKSKLK